MLKPADVCCIGGSVSHKLLVFALFLCAPFHRIGFWNAALFAIQACAASCSASRQAGHEHAPPGFLQASAASASSPAKASVAPPVPPAAACGGSSLSATTTFWGMRSLSNEANLRAGPLSNEAGVYVGPWHATASADSASAAMATRP